MLHNALTRLWKALAGLVRPGPAYLVIVASSHSIHVFQETSMSKRLPILASGYIIAITALNAAHANAKFDGAVSFTIDNPDHVVITPREDGQSAHIFIDEPCATTITISGDGDLSEGQRLVTKTLALEFFDPEAEAVDFDVVITAATPAEPAA